MVPFLGSGCRVRTAIGVNWKFADELVCTVAVLTLSMVVRPPDCVGRERFRTGSFFTPSSCSAGDTRAASAMVGLVFSVSASSSLSQGVELLVPGFLLCNFVISFCVLGLSLVSILYEVFARWWCSRLVVGLRPFLGQLVVVLRRHRSYQRDVAARVSFSALVFARQWVLLVERLRATQCRFVCTRSCVLRF